MSGKKEPSRIDGITGYFVVSLWPDFEDASWMDVALDSVRELLPEARFGFARNNIGGGQIRSERAAKRAAAHHRLGCVGYVTAEGDPPVADRSTVSVRIEHTQGITIGIGWPANGETADSLTTWLPDRFEQLGVLDLFYSSVAAFNPASGYLSTAVKITRVPREPTGLATPHHFPWAYTFRSAMASELSEAAQQSALLSVETKDTHSFIVPAHPTALLPLATRNEMHHVLCSVLPSEPNQGLVSMIPELQQLCLPEVWGGREI